MKVLTAVAAAERLGWGYRFETRLVAMGPVVGGTLRGDLLVVGGGDPSINPRHPARASAFDDWARALKAQDIHHIAGHVVGDDSAIEQPGWGVGWAWDDLVEGYGAAYAALQYHEGEVSVTIGPGATPGAPAVLYLSPSNHGLLVINRAVTGPEGSSASLALAREPGTRFLDVDGQVPLGGAPVTAITAVANPTLFFTDELRATLQRHGIVVDGAAADIDDLSDRPRAAEGRLLLVDQSPPLSELADVTLKWSRNEYAEALLLALDRNADGDGTRRAGGAARDADRARRGRRQLHDPRRLGPVSQRLPVGRRADRDTDRGLGAAASARRAEPRPCPKPGAAARWPIA